MTKLTQKEISNIISWFTLSDNDIKMIMDVKSWKEKLVFWSEIWKKIVEINAKLKFEVENIDQIFKFIHDMISWCNMKISNLEDEIYVEEREKQRLERIKTKIKQITD